MGELPLMVSCTHGQRPAATVCGHMVTAADEIVGFVENSSDPLDLQAWCNACEQLFLIEGDRTPRFQEFTQMTIVCDICYGTFKARHSRLEDAT